MVCGFKSHLPHQIKKTPYRNISDQTTILHMILYNP